jgi:hypothetical protein
MDVTCRTTGASGTVIASGRLMITNSTGAASIFKMINTSTVTVNTTAAAAIDVTQLFGTANASNSISGQTVSVEILN